MELQFHHKEFEDAVRSQLHIFDRAVIDSDAEKITELELSNFDFQAEDCKTLCYFKNLKSLDINIGHTTPEFWSFFPKSRICISFAGETYSTLCH